jgi:hypothetical protein
MDAKYIAFAELVLVFGAVLGFGGWQLWSVRRALREDREKEKSSRSEAAAPDSHEKRDPS